MQFTNEDITKAFKWYSGMAFLLFALQLTHTFGYAYKQPSTSISSASFLIIVGMGVVLLLAAYYYTGETGPENERLNEATLAKVGYHAKIAGFVTTATGVSLFSAALILSVFDKQRTVSIWLGMYLVADVLLYWWVHQALRKLCNSTKSLHGHVLRLEISVSAVILILGLLFRSLPEK